MRNPFAHKPVSVIATQDLEEAKRLLLQEHARAEYHAKMVEYYSDMVDRLEAFIEKDAS